MRKSGHDPDATAVIAERAVLACILELPSLLSQAEAAGITDAHFVLSEHAKAFRTMQRLREFDAIMLSGKVDADVIGSLIASGHVAALFPKYVEAVLQNRIERDVQLLSEQLIHAKNGTRLPLTQQIMELLTHAAGASRGIFHSRQDFENAPDLSFGIENFLQQDAINFVAGLAGHSKTMLLLSITKARLTGKSLFGCDLFRVPQASAKTIYLIPESSAGPFWARIKLFRLEEFVPDRLLVRTLSCREEITGLEDPRLLDSVKGADVILDTAIRFMSGSENDAECSREFAGVLFRLLAAGARSVIAAHHSPKSFEGVDRPTLESALRGSSDLGAMVAVCWVVRQIDPDSNQVYVSCVKARDFQPAGDFVLEGRPHLDQHGDFKVIAQPGLARSLRDYLEELKDSKPGRPRIADDMKAQQAAKLRAEGKSLREIGRQLGVSKDTADRLLFSFDSQKGKVQ